MPRALPHLFTIILLLGMGAKGHAASVDVNDPSSIEAFFDIAFEIQKFDHELAGSTVVVVKDGKILFKKGYGFADIEKRVLVDPDRHLFRIASVSKPFT
jgi:CubicO group peptidase (beta-lactamase class C family)